METMAGRKGRCADRRAEIWKHERSARKWILGATRYAALRSLQPLVRSGSSVVRRAAGGPSSRKAEVLSKAHGKMRRARPRVRFGILTYE